jgi:hypothetical protein
VKVNYVIFVISQINTVVVVKDSIIERKMRKKIRQDDLMSFTYYGRVCSSNNSTLIVQDCDSGRSFSVQGKPLIDGAGSADLFSETQTVNRTWLSEKMHSVSRGTLFTVKFTKLDGDPRVLRGRFLRPDYEGRILAEDLELDHTDHRERKVDLRTMEYVVLDGIKYVVKTKR